MLTRIPEAGYVHAGMACYLCLKAEDLIDTGRSIEGEGVLAICTTCVADMAMTAGMDPQAEAEVELMAGLVGDLTTERDAHAKLIRKLRKDLRQAKADLAVESERASRVDALADKVETYRAQYDQRD